MNLDGLLEDLQQVVNDLYEAYSKGNMEDVRSLAEELRAMGTTIEHAAL